MKEQVNDNSTEQEIVPTSVKILSEGLQEAATQLLRGDADRIATRVGKTVQVIRPYLKGAIGDFETGKTVLRETRAFIMEREKEVKKLVA